MSWEQNRGQRLQREAKAIQRKAQRRGVDITGRDAARLKKVNGRIVKYGFEPEEDDDYGYQD